MKKYILIILSALAIASCPAAAFTALAATTNYAITAGSFTLPAYSSVSGFTVYFQNGTCFGQPCGTWDYHNLHITDNNASVIFDSDIAGAGAPNPYTSSFTTSTLSAGSYSISISAGSSYAISIDINGTAGASTCSPDTIDHGTIGSYPTCAITCDNGYHEDAGACVVDAGPPGPSSAGGSSISPGDLTLGTGLSADIVQSVSGVVSTPGVLALLIVAIGIPLFFFIVIGVIDLLKFQNETDKEFKRVMKKYD